MSKSLAQFQSISKTVKQPAGITMRKATTIAGFRLRHGQWPDAIEIPSGMLAALATEMLTPLGFFLLQSKLDITTEIEATLMARGKTNDGLELASEYGAHSVLAEVSSRQVADWLGWDDPSSEDPVEP